MNIGSKTLLAITLIALMTLSVSTIYAVPGFSADNIDITNDENPALGDGGEKGHTIIIEGYPDSVASGYEVLVYWDGENGLLNITEAESDGGFEIWFTVPEADVGTHYLWFEATDQEANPMKEFTVLPHIELSSRFGAQGSEINIAGYGFVDDEYVILNMGDVYIQTFKTDILGSFDGSFIVPTLSSGNYKLKAEQPSYGISVEKDFRIGLMIVLISPFRGSVGTNVTLTGTGFTEGGSWNATLGDIAIVENGFVDEDSNLELNGDTPTFYVPDIEPRMYNLTVLDIETDIEIEVEFEVTYTHGEYDIILYKGWNLIGIPCVPADPSIEVVLADILDNVESVWTFDGDTKTWSSYAPSAPSDLTDMVEDRGYWINMKTDDILTIYCSYVDEEGIVTEVDSELGTSCFIYSTDEYQIAVILPTYLEVSTPYSKSASEIDVYLKPLVSLSGLFSVDVEVGIKLKIPAFSVWVFSDVDVTILGDFKPDIFRPEFPIFGLPMALDLEEGDLGIYALSIPTVAGAVSLEDLPIDEWSYVASYDVYTVMEPSIISLGLTAEDITIGSVEESIEETTIYYVGSINSDVYHRPTCYYVDSIHEDNKIYFSSKEEAELAGYRPCLVCNP